MATFALHRLSANRRWIPFLNQIKERNIKRSINYGEIQTPLPFASEKFGIFGKNNYQFNDSTLSHLANELSLFKELEKDVTYGVSEKPKYFFDFGKAFDDIQLNQILSFIYDFPRDQIELRLTGINWKEKIQEFINRIQEDE